MEVRPVGGATGTPTILAHLLTLPAQTLIRLFSYPSNALAIFRLLPPLARHLVLALLFLPDPPNLPSEDVAMLFSKESAAAATSDDGAASRKAGRASRGLRAASDVLTRLGIIREQGGLVYLNGKWTEALRRALIGGGNHQSFGVPSMTPVEDRLSPGQLDEFALRSWESILLFMVATDNVRSPSKPVMYLLRSAGLMQTDGGGSLTITSKGFQFLLDDVATQLWMLLHAYLITLSESASAQANSTADIVEHLTFLFTLGSATLGQDYELSSLAPSQRDMVGFFSDLGLVYRRSAKSSCFYPTRLITTLTNAGPLPMLGSGSGQASADGSAADGGGAGSSSDDGKGFVILETNYKVYAYTSNQLRINILQLFVHVRARFPNLVTGSITRDSVKAALRKGIDAEQIIMYLTHHAHPQMYKNNPLLPVTVTDQIRLWEREKNRVQSDEGGILREFSSGADFAMVREYADQMGVLLWSDSNKRKMFVASTGIQPVLDFINRRLESSHR